jgi:cysteine desulfurase
MTGFRIYLDGNATAPLRPEAREAMTGALTAAGNASSVHGEGRDARRRIEDARQALAAAIDADPEAVVFTSCATEANALALVPELELKGEPVRCGVLLVSAVEHPSVLAGGRFASDSIRTIAVDRDGVVDRAALDRMLSECAAAAVKPLVSVMAANNETGAMQPLREIADRVHAVGGVFHTDAVQALGKVEFSLRDSGADLASFSAHKLGGPQGAGALVAAHRDTRLPSLIRGGGQEQGRRAGTENIAAIAGFGAAVNAAVATLLTEQARLANLQRKLEQGLLAIAPQTTIFGTGADRLPNTTCFAVPGIAAETALIAFDLEGVAISTGSACSSGKVAPSAVLAAMKVPVELSRGAMRVTTGWNSSEAEIDRFLAVWSKIYTSLVQRGGARAA